MCVILFAPPKRQITNQQLWNAFENNRDGSGIMFYDNKGNVHWQKGFMQFEEMRDFWNGLDDNLPRAVHCRIATSGLVNKKNCHPFKISNNFKEMQKLKGVSASGCMMHNGVLNDYTPPEKMKCNYSDTMFFNKEVLAPIVNGGGIENDGTKTLIEKLGSCFLLFLPNFKTIMFGKWVTDEKGFYASNNSYSYNKYYCGYDMGWYDDYDYNSYTMDTIENIYPRYKYLISFEEPDELVPYFRLDDFVDDLGDFIICTDEIYLSCSQCSNDGKFDFVVHTFDVIDGLLPSGFKIESCEKITK